MDRRTDRRNNAPNRRFDLEWERILKKALQPNALKRVARRLFKAGKTNARKRHRERRRQ
jgi:hypothetical protein